jgi:16S rRNA processing protein RimM
VSGKSQHWVAVAHILRPRGNKGEVAAELLTDFPQRLTELREAFLSDDRSQAEPQRRQIKACWLNQNHSGQAVFHFEGSSSIDDAEELRGLDVLLPIEQRVTLPAGQYFISDLIGCSVFEGACQTSPVASSPCAMMTAPLLLGSVTDVQFTGEGISGTPLLVVDAHEGELLIPLAEDICTKIDPAARRIDVLLPEGLRELNSE